LQCYGNRINPKEYIITYYQPLKDSNGISDEETGSMNGRKGTREIHPQYFNDLVGPFI